MHNVEATTVILAIMAGFTAVVVHTIITIPAGQFVLMWV
jgi:hypothetical protein